MKNPNKMMKTDAGTYELLAYRECGEGMFVTAYENIIKHTIHVGLLDSDSGEYVNGSVRIYPETYDRDVVNSYMDELLG